ncbi:MAG TPA: DNA-3-methyladenine glycosylase [Dehalococcoidia bacterium]|nr:DNA-3-methyladenine glycosylase [Dehalococcoidia bacterium]
MKLDRHFYQQDARKVARGLLGKYLVFESQSGRFCGRIVETEAYLGERDTASHAFHGRTRRTEVMYGEGGHLYVYFTYGMHWLMNVVTGREGSAEAVLLRAVEPVEGIALMNANRGGKALRLLTSGPARVAQAFGVDGSLNGADLCGDLIWIEARGDVIRASQIVATKRIGVGYARAWKDRKLRFYLADSEFVSKAPRRRLRRLDDVASRDH